MIRAMRAEWKAMAELITDEMLEVSAATGTWSDIGARVRERDAGLLERVSLRGAEELGPGDSRWAKIPAGAAA